MENCEVIGGETKVTTGGREEEEKVVEAAKGVEASRCVQKMV